MKIPQVKTNKPVQLTFPFFKRKPKQVQLAFRFPKTNTKENKLNRLA